MLRMVLHLGLQHACFARFRCLNLAHNCIISSKSHSIYNWIGYQSKMTEQVKAPQATLSSIAIKREDEEASNKRRLFYDGHGTGEDKRLINIIKNVSKLYLVEHTDDKFHELYNVVSKDITAAIGQTDRQMKISGRCDKEMTNIEQNIDDQMQQVERAKVELANLQLELEYVDKLKKISIYPDCQTTELAIREVEERKEKLSFRVKKCRDHILTILKSCRELRQVLDDEITDEVVEMKTDT